MRRRSHEELTVADDSALPGSIRAAYGRGGVGAVHDIDAVMGGWETDAGEEAAAAGTATQTQRVSQVREMESCRAGGATRLGV